MFGNEIKPSELEAQPRGGSDSQQFVPFRPIQYLGNKLRTLPNILAAAESLVEPGSRVVDLFTGTTVVAQGLATRGFEVTAVDTQRYAKFFAKALLGIGRAPGEACDFATIAKAGLATPNNEFRALWAPFLNSELKAIQHADAMALASLSDDLPLIWRTLEAPFRMHVEAGIARSAYGELPLLTSIYSGSYFGIEQALAIDELRQNAETARVEGRLSDWQYCAAVTAIMTAASAAVHSAGKHFAQPLNSGKQRNQKFLASRLLQDRRIDIMAEFKSACDSINANTSGHEVKHQAWLGSAESFVESDGVADLYYLDPPYTAQQYSRFYHVLETICSYEYPQLFEKGAVTTGLYPTNRYKSAFSSKRKTASAFMTIISAARTNDAAVAISYSQSAASSHGNARMITLEKLVELCTIEFGRNNVEWYQLSHRYRQFNSASASNAKRDDPEILITCKPR